MGQLKTYNPIYSKKDKEDNRDYLRHLRHTLDRTYEEAFTNSSRSFNVYVQRLWQFRMMSPAWHQTITWRNPDILSIWYLNPVYFELKHCKILTRKCFWKCRLWNGGHFSIVNVSNHSSGAASNFKRFTEQQVQSYLSRVLIQLTTITPWCKMLKITLTSTFHTEENGVFDRTENVYPPARDLWYWLCLVNSSVYYAPPPPPPPPLWNSPGTALLSTF